MVFLGHVPPGFWHVPANRRRYMQWLGKQLGFCRARDWYAIRREAFETHRGGTLLNYYSSMYDLMQEFLPQLDWEPFKYGPPLNVAQILELADAYFAEHERWPHCHSGPVAGTNFTWSAIAERLRAGHVGFQAGSSVAGTPGPAPWRTAWQVPTTVDRGTDFWRGPMRSLPHTVDGRARGRGRSTGHVKHGG